MIATGELNTRLCQPLAVSLLKVPVASSVPELVHSEPVWVPVLAALL